jgi:hypothetical protein
MPTKIYANMTDWWEQQSFCRIPKINWNLCTSKWLLTLVIHLIQIFQFIVNEDFR